jgi:hypothetical protein
VHARGALGALQRTFDLGINPGGEAMVMTLHSQPPAACIDHLLSERELAALFDRL